MVVSFGKEGPSHPYYFVVSCIFSAQMHEIAWIAGRDESFWGPRVRCRIVFGAWTCDVGLLWGLEVRHRIALGSEGATPSRFGLRDSKAKRWAAP